MNKSHILFRRTSTLRRLGLLATTTWWSLVQQGCGEKEVEAPPADPADVAPEKNATLPEDRPVWHPIQDFARRGLSPALMQATGGSHRWAVEEGVVVSEQGDVVFSGGAIQLERRELSPADAGHPGHAKYLAISSSGQPLQASRRSRIHAPLAARMATAVSSEVLEVWIGARRPDDAESPLFVELEREVGERRIATVGDEQQRRLELMEARDDRALLQRAKLEAVVVTEGGEVVHRCARAACVVARLPTAGIERLAGHDLVGTLSVADTSLRPTSDGVAVVEGSGLASFIAQGYTGERGPGADLHLAVIEQAPFHDNHDGFRDSAGGPFRIGERLVCTADYCDPISDFVPMSLPPGDKIPAADVEGQHATNVLGIAIGDLTYGQDPAVTDPQVRRQRSGIARDAYAHLIQYDKTVAGLQKGFSALRSLTPRAPVALLAQGAKPNPNEAAWDCLGDDPISEAVDRAYENGVLTIVAAGNEAERFPDRQVCNVNAPGAALSAFTVGGHGWPSTDPDPRFKDRPAVTDAAGVRQAPIWAGSAWGGMPEDSWLYRNGRDRTVVDISAYGGWREMFSVTQSGPETSGYLFSLMGTSMAAAVMAGAAIDFLDYFMANAAGFGEADTFIQQPGALFANLLLLGDRQGVIGNCPSWDASRVCSGFDNRWGAGRLAMRRPDLLVGPAAWRTGALVLHEFEIVRLELNGGMPLPACSDVTAVIHWYDPIYGLLGNVDDLDLYLAIDGERVLLSQTAGDNKERVVRRVPAGKIAALDLVGFRVNESDHGFGAGGMRAYWAYFWEKAADSRGCS